MKQGFVQAFFFALSFLWVSPLCHGYQGELVTPRSPRFVFLTGGTGFVGSNVVREILQCDPNVKVACLVRSEDPAGATRRLKAALNKFGNGNYDPSRVQATPGDIIKPNLGMTQQDFDFWAHNSESVVHCAADIGLSKDATANGEKAIDNVIGFVDAGNHPSSLHFVSSAAAVGLAKTNIVYECGDYPLSTCFPGGYGEAKHAAETRIKSWAAENGDRLSYIYRAPFIIGNVPQRHTVPDILFKLISLLGVFPTPRKYLPLCTINHLAKSMAHTIVYGDEVLKTGRINHEAGVPKILHTVSDQQTWAEQFDLIREALPTTRKAGSALFQELSQIARAHRTTQICRISKKACSPIAVGLLGSVLEQDIPCFSTKSTWKFLMECKLDPTVGKMTNRDIQLAFAAATGELAVKSNEYVLETVDQVP